MTPATNPTLPAGELLEILRWLNPAASPRIVMGAGTPGTAGGEAPGAELASMRVIPGLRAGSDPLQPVPRRAGWACPRHAGWA